MRNPVVASGRPAPPAQLKALTSLRFLAALHVALFHLVPGLPSGGLVQLLISTGYTGVSFFFLLSGFILTYSHGREYASGRGSAKQFYFARFARIYPVYLLSMIFAGVLGRGLFAEHRHILVYAVDLAMLQSWSVHMVGFFNGPGWTLSCEAFFYAVFPLLVLRLRPHSPGRATAGFLAFWVLSQGAPVWCMVHTFGWHWGAWVGHWENLLEFTMIRVPVFPLPEFLAGISLGWLLLQSAPSRRAAFWLVVGGGAALLGCMLGSREIPWIMLHNGLLIPAYAAVILGLSRETVFSRVLSARALVLLGEASYVFYLAHFLFHHWVMDRFGVGDGLGAGVLEILALIPISIGIHLAVERPARRALLEWRKRRAVREREPAGLAAA
jgi:peptidoglycan/LPS O-acetylase OafA/YrhL